MSVRFVMDTNVLVAGLWSDRGAAFRLLSMLGGSVIQPVLSVPLVLEYESVLHRRSVELKLNSGDIDAVLDYLCAIGEHHAIYYLWRPTLKDPRDEFVLELAVVAGCRYVVTHNVRDFVGSEAFGVHAIKPAEFLQSLGVLR